MHEIAKGILRCFQPAKIIVSEPLRQAVFIGKRVERQILGIIAAGKSERGGRIKADIIKTRLGCSGAQADHAGAMIRVVTC